MRDESDRESAVSNGDWRNVERKPPRQYPVKLVG
jgi:hypothetical protein